MSTQRILTKGEIVNELTKGLKHLPDDTLVHRIDISTIGANAYCILHTQKPYTLEEGVLMFYLEKEVQ